MRCPCRGRSCRAGADRSATDARLRRRRARRRNRSHPHTIDALRRLGRVLERLGVGEVERLGKHGASRGRRGHGQDAFARSNAGRRHHRGHLDGYKDGRVLRFEPGGDLLEARGDVVDAQARNVVPHEAGRRHRVDEGDAGADQDQQEKKQAHHAFRSHRRSGVCCQ